MPLPQKLESRLFLLCLSLMLVFNGLFYALAEETTGETVATEIEGVDYACGQAVTEQASVLIDSYQTFLDDYFKVDTPSSSQVDHAMRYYRYMESSIEAIYENNLDLYANTTLQDSTQASSDCAGRRDFYLDVARALLQKQVIASANSKRTFEVIDGLKIMNADLEEFSDEFNAVFPAYFNKFNNALPCYARQCIVK